MCSETKEKKLKNILLFVKVYIRKEDSKEEKQAVRIAYPGHVDSWYKNYIRNMRKQRTADYFNLKYNLLLNDFDVADSFGIAHYANKELTKR